MRWGEIWNKYCKNFCPVLCHTIGQKFLQFFVHILGEMMAAQIHSKLYWPLVVLGYFNITGLKAFSILFFTKFFFHAVWSDRTEEGINGSKLGNWVILDLNPPKRVWNLSAFPQKGCGGFYILIILGFYFYF